MMSENATLINTTVIHINAVLTAAPCGPDDIEMHFAPLIPSVPEAPLAPSPPGAPMSPRYPTSESHTISDIVTN